MNPHRRPGYPIELRLEGRRVVVLGDKATARRPLLEACGAIIDSEDTQLAGAFLVLLTAPVDPAAAGALRERCRAHGALLWVEDSAALSDVTFPALLESGPVRIAVSTGGRSSALTRAVRDALRPVFGARFAAWAQGVVDRGERRPRCELRGAFEIDDSEPPTEE